MLYTYPVLPAYHYIMNHNYPPFTTPATSQSSHRSRTSRPPPLPPQYGYSMHHNSYHPPPIGFPQVGYPPYASPMVMYGAPPRPNPPLDLPRGPSSGQQSPPPTNPGKRKRKSTADSAQGRADKDSDHEGGGSGSDRPKTCAPTAAEMKKRTKTQRACDSCRSRKIRYLS